MQGDEAVALIVDDEAFARLFAAQVLMDLGLYVLEACDAADATAMLRNNADILVVLTDISMPGQLDGLQLAAHVRDFYPHIPVVVTSGFICPANTSDVGYFLAKPYTASALIESICRAVRAPLEASPMSIHLNMLGGAG
jgi:CheY-like chemotaxis protein